MKKLFFIVVIITITFSAFAGGKSELDKLVNPDSIAYIEINNPEKGIESVDALLEDFGLFDILGFQSIKQELLKESDNLDLQYVDFRKPIGFSVVYNQEIPDNMGVMAYFPLKNKKDFDKMLQSFNPEKNQVLVNDGDYAVLASSEILIKNFPYKQKFDMSALKEKDKHLMSAYISMENLFSITNDENQTLRDMLFEELNASPEMDDTTNKIMNAYIGIFEQMNNAVLYADLDGTVISTDSKLSFNDKSKVAEFFGKIPAGKNITDLLEYVPDGYMLNFAADAGSETPFLVTKMISDLVYQDNMSNADKAQMDSLSKAMSELSGPTAGAMNMDLGKLMTMSMMAQTSGQFGASDQLDLMELSGIEMFMVMDSSNPAAYMEGFERMVNSDAYKNYTKDIGGQESKVDYSYNSGIDYKGISFDEFYISTQNRRQKPDEFGMEIPSISINYLFYLAHDGNMLYMGVGDNIRDTIADIINNGGKPAVSVLDKKTVKNAMNDVPDDAVIVSSFSMLNMINSMIGGLTGGMDFGQMMGGGDSEGGIAYITIDDSDVFMKSTYDVSELQSVISLLGMIVQFSEMNSLVE